MDFLWALSFFKGLPIRAPTLKVSCDGVTTVFEILRPVLGTTGITLDLGFRYHGVSDQFEYFEGFRSKPKEGSKGNGLGASNREPQEYSRNTKEM